MLMVSLSDKHGAIVMLVVSFVSVVVASLSPPADLISGVDGACRRGLADRPVPCVILLSKWPILQTVGSTSDVLKSRSMCCFSTGTLYVVLHIRPKATMSRWLRS